MHRKARDAKTGTVTNPTRRNIERVEKVRHELWTAKLWSPTFASSEALRKVETWEVAGLLGWREQNLILT